MNQEQKLITLSKSAAAHIEKMLAQREAAKGFRLSVKQIGCSGYSYSPEIIYKVNENDVVMKGDKNIPVYIDKKWLHVLKGTKIDLVDKGLGQTQLQFSNPNVEDACGCGESFNVKEVEAVS